jgi:hypothetical protein
MNSTNQVDSILARWLANDVQADHPSPVDIGSLYDLFERMNDPSFYAISIGGGGGGGNSGKCCSTGTCENINH